MKALRKLTRSSLTTITLPLPVKGLTMAASSMDPQGFLLENL